MKNNLILWFPLFWILFLLRNKWKNKCFNLYTSATDKRVYNKIIKYKKYNKSGKNSKIALFPKVLIYVFFLAIKSQSNYEEISDIKVLSKHDFFTYESISVTNRMSMIVLKQNFMLLKIFYLKIIKHENKIEHFCYSFY